MLFFVYVCVFILPFRNPDIFFHFFKFKKKIFLDIYVLCFSSLAPRTDSQPVLMEASRMLQEKYGFAHTTLQVEYYQDEMDNCGPCQRKSGAGRVGSLLN